MKHSAERRLLLALLLSSLIPVLGLGILTGAAVFRMGEQVADLTQHTRQVEWINNLRLRSLEQADALTAFLRGREDDLRALSLLEPTAENYRAFFRSTLGGLSVSATADAPHERIWIPLYTEISFIDRGGRTVVAVRDGEVVTPDRLRHRPEFAANAKPQGTATTTTMPRLRIHPLPDSSCSGCAVCGASLPISLAVAESTVRPAGTIMATIDKRQLAARLQPRRPAPGEATPQRLEHRYALFFDASGSACLFPARATRGDDPLHAFLHRNQDNLIAGIRAGRSGLITAAQEDRVLTYTPVLQGAGPFEDPTPLAGLLICTGLSPATPAGASQSMASVTQETELQIGILTLISVFGVSLAALLVAQRMARPWTRLREKARQVVDSGGSDDEVAEISRSFDNLASQVAASAGRLRASEERLRDFIEMTPDGIAVAGTAGHILHSNRALCQMFRRTPAELARLNVRDLWVRAEDWDEMLDRLRAAGRLKNYEVTLRRGDGSEFPALLTLRLHGHEDDESIDIITRDISDMKEIQQRDRTKTETLFRVYGELSKAHQELRKAYTEVEEQVHDKTAQLRHAYEALQASDRVKTEFLMKMSHELRTPLNCIIGYSEAMIDGIDGPLSAEQSVSLERIAESGQRLLRLISNLLDVSRMEAGKMDIACVETSVEAAVQDVLHQAQPLVGERPIQLDVSLETPLPGVWADPDRLRQVLFNLVGNALKFTEQGTVEITARKLASGPVAVCVRDTGPGIAAQQLPLVFEKFVQLPGANRSGAGLGLAICRELVENMGGTIAAESEPGVGSAFTFTLPTAAHSSQLQLPFPSAPG